MDQRPGRADIVTDASVVILGAGQAGFQVATSLRDNGFDGRIFLIGDEPDLPYERPPLTKGYLLGQKKATDLPLRPEAHYGSRRIELLLGEEAVAIDRQSRSVTLRSGTTIQYGHLVFATGARNRILEMASGIDGIAYVRTLREAEKLRQHLDAAQQVGIVGAGFIGLELAAVLRKLGKSVHVLETMSRVMGRAVSPAVSDFFTATHRGWGSELVFENPVAGIEASAGAVRGVRGGDGSFYPADLVLIGIGVIANAELAASAGLPVQNGIVVDEYLRTPDASISAIGDCAAFPSRHGSELVRLESVQNAVDQARCVAARLVGRLAPYADVPWFWSDQGDLKLQMVGLTASADQTVIRGDPRERKFSVFCYRNGKILGIESINRPGDHMFGRKLLASGADIAPSQAQDPSFDLKAYLLQQSGSSERVLATQVAGSIPIKQGRARDR
jgi:3-phenylpropionate/trans-cinnamate dioxygenase ferredoxin reductase subunit